MAYRMEEVVEMFLNPAPAGGIKLVDRLYADFFMTEYWVEHQNGAIYIVEFIYICHEIRIKLNDEVTKIIPVRYHREIFEHMQDITEEWIQTW